MSSASHELPSGRPEKEAKLIDMREFIIKVIRERGGRKDGWRKQRDEDILARYDDPVGVQAQPSAAIGHLLAGTTPNEAPDAYPEIHLDMDWSDYDIDESDDWVGDEK